MSFLKLKKDLIVRWRGLWVFWCIHLMGKYAEDSRSNFRRHARYLWKQYNHGFSPSIRFTPLECLNASYYQASLWEGDFLPDDDDADPIL